MNAVGKGSNPVRVVRLRPAFESFAGSGSGYVEVELHLTVSESLLGVRLRPASDHRARFGTGYVEVCLYLKVSESLRGVRLRPASDHGARFGTGYGETSRRSGRLIKRPRRRMAGRQGFEPR